MPGTLRLDHLVYAVPDLGDGVAQLEAALGVPTLPGGQHDGLGTHNAILPLERSSYVEVIALDPANPSPAMPPPFGLKDLSEARLVTWAVHSYDFESDTDRARQNGYDPGLTVPLSRTMPGGEKLEWKLTVRPEPLGGGLIPFVIDWGATPHPSRPEDGDVARGSLSAFEGFHPEPSSVEDTLQALGARLRVRRADAPRLHASLVGPSGRVEIE